jgi:DNA-binding NarL/FixJ family response regulator
LQAPGSIAEWRHQTLEIFVRVFLAQDCLVTRSVLPDMLTRIGGLRLVARERGAREALSWIDTHPGQWDLCVVELEQEARQLDLVTRARALRPGVKVVVVSTFDSPEIQAECLGRGADAVFHKLRPGDFALWLEQQALAAPPHP